MVQDVRRLQVDYACNHTIQLACLASLARTFSNVIGPCFANPLVISQPEILVSGELVGMTYICAT